MIACIVTGHGEFSLGLKDALEMIAGPQELFEAIPFTRDETTDAFEVKLVEAIKHLTEQAEGLLIFTDLKGGTPFKIAMTHAIGQENTIVLTGTNLPALIESIGGRLMTDNVENLAHALQISPDCQLEVVQLKTVQEEGIDSEGI
ncbi:PTS sugar transporter subunit IIA [Lactococcus formosensis]|uniref:PTS sugar transporter subunit IIA n=1 Tax=Lactococcus formosensis TaxID=1281486 RepID=UPI0022E2CE79|nr:PTS N-acetylgalactosamine IIA subunit [Lactococcus formosensis]